MARQSAYETLYAFTDVAYHRMRHQELYDRMVEGFGDDYDIKTINHLMLARLMALDGEEVARRLDGLAVPFQATLSTKLKDNAVKQEFEKLQEAVKDVLRTSARLNERFPEAAGPSSTTPRWSSFVEMLQRDFKQQLSSASEEVTARA